MESNNSMIESIYLTDKYTQSLKKATKVTSEFKKIVDKATKSLSIEMITKKRYTAVTNDYTKSIKVAAKEISEFKEQVDEAANSLKKMSKRKYDINIDNLKLDDAITNIKTTIQIKKIEPANKDFDNIIPDNKVWGSIASGMTQSLGEAVEFSGKVTKVYKNIKGKMIKYSSSIIGFLAGRLNPLAGAIIKIGGTVIGGISSAIGKYVKWVNSIVGKAISMLAPVAGAMASFSAKALVSAGQMEQTYLSLERITGDKGQTDQLMDGLKNVAITSPFNIDELAQGSQLLLSYGFALDQVIPMLKTAGNASVGLNQGTGGVNSILSALGQIKSMGNLGIENIDQLDAIGIDAWGYLEKSFGKSEKGIKKLVRQGLIPADKAIQSIVDGMNQDPKFINQMLNQSKTLFGLFENIKEIFDLNILLPFGEGIRDGILPHLTKFVDKITGSQEKLQGFSDSLKNIGNMVGDFLGQRLEQAMNYFDNLNNDEEFQQMSFGDKLIRVMSDALDGIIEWLDNGGSDKLSEILNKGIQIAAKLIDTVGPQLEDIGMSITGAVTKGALKGLGGTLIDKVKEWIDVEPPDNIKIMEAYNKSVFRFEESKESDSNSHVAGLSFVPNDNYPALLHRGERVLTAQANRSYQQGGNVTITIPKLADVIQASSPTDVDSFINKFKNELVLAANNMGGAG